MKYTCPVNPDHEDCVIKETDADSPHRAEIVCAECDEHIKWASKQDVVLFNTVKVQEINEAEIENTALCPLMSGMVIWPARSEVRPARLRFEGTACIKERCAWWTKIDNVCAVTSIAFALLELKPGGMA